MIWLTRPHHSLSSKEIRTETEGRNLEGPGGAEAEAIEDAMDWLVPQLAQPSAQEQHQITPTPTINKENT